LAKRFDFTPPAWGFTSTTFGRAGRWLKQEKACGSLSPLAFQLRHPDVAGNLGEIEVSIAGMLAAAGYLPPLKGAVLQEIIDVAAFVNAVRVALPYDKLTDFSGRGPLLGQS
jgi:hypothetical protein